MVWAFRHDSASANGSRPGFVHPISRTPESLVVGREKAKKPMIGLSQP